MVLGATGRNFAAGMSGGIAYVFDEDGALRANCNLDTVALERLEEEDASEIEQMICRHVRYTNSERARKILVLWNDVMPKFIKVMPKDYRRMLEAVQRVEKQGLSGDRAIMAAFEENKSDLARVSGN